MKTATNRARPGAKNFTMAIAEAQPKSGASLDSHNALQIANLR
jgi:hypothetical protein